MIEIKLRNLSHAGPAGLPSGTMERERGSRGFTCYSTLVQIASGSLSRYTDTLH